MTRVFFYLFPILFFLYALAQQPRERTHSRILIPQGNIQVLSGADLYYEKCSVCHGDTALGYAEAKRAFPPEERSCEKCHRPKNPPQMVMAQMKYNFAFSIGKPPPLRGETAPHSLANGAALYNYILATMPRPFPGALSEAEALAITAFLLEANGVSLAEELTLETAYKYSLDSY